jgi:hypothetical protein
VALYVDDLIIACSNQQLCNNLEKSLAKKFKIEILGEISHILGMDVKVDIPEHTIHLSQQQYIRNTYNTFKEYGIYNYTTPMDFRAQLSKAMFFRKTQALSYQKSRKDKNKNACGLMAENRHTHTRK